MGIALRCLSRIFFLVLRWQKTASSGFALIIMSSYSLNDYRYYAGLWLNDQFGERWIGGMRLSRCYYPFLLLADWA